MPEIYIKDQPHQPIVSVTGHFMGMQPVWPLLVSKLQTVWYRGDDVNELIAKIATLTKAIAELYPKTGRRPPKRAGDKRG